MGWWEEEELTLGDEPFDICQCALRQTIVKYEHHVGRPPTLQEVLVYVRHALNTVGAESMPDLESIEVQSINIKSKKTPKRQSYDLGDYFAIPLDGEFAYGRYVHKSVDALVEIYELFTGTMLTLQQLRHRQPAVRTWKYVFSRDAFGRRRWIVLGSAPIEPDHEFPLFYMGLGNSLPLGNVGPLRHRYSRDSAFGADPEQLEGIESHFVWSPKAIEDHLKARAPDPWPEVIENWKEDGVPWRGKKSKYPVFFKDLRLEKLRGILLRPAKFSETDLELILRLKNARVVTIKCDDLKTKKKRDKIAQTLKNKLPKLTQIYINDEFQQLDEETGTWRYEA
jgi:hypothetical protein